MRKMGYAASSEKRNERWSLKRMRMPATVTDAVRHRISAVVNREKVFVPPSARSSAVFRLTIIGTPEEVSEVCEAIKKHKKRSKTGGGLTDVLYRADKLSRNCFMCDAREECYWSEDKKNKSIYF